MKYLIVILLLLPSYLIAADGKDELYQVELIVIEYKDAKKRNKNITTNNLILPAIKYVSTIDKLKKYGLEKSSAFLLKNNLKRLEANDRYNIIKYISYLQPKLKVIPPLSIADGEKYLILTPHGILNAINLKFNKISIISLKSFKKQWLKEFKMPITNADDKISNELIEQLNNNHHKVDVLHKLDGSISLINNEQNELIFYVDISLLQDSDESYHITNHQAIEFLDQWFLKMPFKKTLIHHLKQNIKIKLGQTYYLDHNNFGVIIQVAKKKSSKKNSKF
jgi:hypothetical protein